VCDPLQAKCGSVGLMQEGDLEGCLRRALDGGADIIVSSGGVSMGDRDLIKPLLERSGKVHCGRVLMKPGKPLTFATMDVTPQRRVLFFGLPGVTFGDGSHASIRQIGNDACLDRQGTGCGPHACRLPQSLCCHGDFFEQLQGVCVF
jgi:hypothetical protein